jgi:Pilus formation protein N terminal region
MPRAHDVEALGRGNIMRGFIAARVRRTAQMAALLVVTVSSVAGAQTIVVTMDQAKLARVPPRTATLVVGNPLIADVSVQAGGAMVITGKGYGVTNLIALDSFGHRIYESLVRVQGPAENVVVYRGGNRESYICEPNCERRITVGDSADYFSATVDQTSARSNRAMSGQAPATGAR